MSIIPACPGLRAAPHCRLPWRAQDFRRRWPFQEVLPAMCGDGLRNYVDPGFRNKDMAAEKFRRSVKPHGNQATALVINVAMRITSDIVSGFEAAVSSHRLGGHAVCTTAVAVNGALGTGVTKTPVLPGLISWDWAKTGAARCILYHGSTKIRCTLLPSRVRSSCAIVSAFSATYSGRSACPLWAP